MLGSKKIIASFSSLIGFIAWRWLGSLLDPLFVNLNQRLADNSTGFLLQSITYAVSFLLIKIPIYSILLFILITFFVYKSASAILLKYRKLTITKAPYGSVNAKEDISNQLNDQIINNRLEIKLNNNILGRDPAPRTKKTCEITYQIGKKTRTKKYRENDLVKLP